MNLRKAQPLASPCGGREGGSEGRREGGRGDVRMCVCGLAFVESSMARRAEDLSMNLRKAQPLASPCFVCVCAYLNVC